MITTLSCQSPCQIYGNILILFNWPVSQMIIDVNRMIQLEASLVLQLRIKEVLF